MKLAKNKLKIQYVYFLGFLMLLPRMAITYPVYTITAGVLALKKGFEFTSILFLVSIFLLGLIHVAIISFFYKVSYVNYILDFVQVAPFFLLMLRPFLTIPYSVKPIVMLNYGVLILSVLNMMVNYGFPLKLPYINFLPDAISAFWGNGGVKITTICGLFGIFSLIRNSEYRSKLNWFVMLFNFILPSYNIGIFCGSAALGFMAARRMTLGNLIRFSVIGLIISLTVLPYILERLELLNSVFINEFGVHPKVYTLISFFKLAVNDMGVFLFGGGLGNVSGAASLWANQTLTSISSHTPLNVPGMIESELHIRTVGEAISIADKYPWAISSSINKPFFTIATIFLEFGLVIGGFTLVYFFRTLLTGGVQREYSIMITIFLFLIFCLDNLHVNPLFWCSILIGMRALVQRKGDRIS